MRVEAEFTTEPFRGEGEPPEHATAALEAARDAGLECEFGPLGTSVRGERDVEYFRLEQVTIKTARPFPYQIDGDPAGHTPVTVAIVPGALRVLVPRRPGP